MQLCPVITGVGPAHSVIFSGRSSDQVVEKEAFRLPLGPFHPKPTRLCVCRSRSTSRLCFRLIAAMCDGTVDDVLGCDFAQSPFGKAVLLPNLGRHIQRVQLREFGAQPCVLCAP
jgi:hypothetical protein